MSNKTKTTQEWLESVKEEFDWAEKALVYAEEANTLFADNGSLSRCLSGAFIWSGTEEGQKYWEKIFDHLYNQNR